MVTNLHQPPHRLPAPQADYNRPSEALSSSPPCDTLALQFHLPSGRMTNEGRCHFLITQSRTAGESELRCPLPTSPSCRITPTTRLLARRRTAPPAAPRIPPASRPSPPPTERTTGKTGTGGEQVLNMTSRHEVMISRSVRHIFGADPPRRGAEPPRRGAGR